MGFAQQILTTVAVTTIVWLVVTFATSPEPMSKLISFYENVEPAGLGWRPVAAAAGLSERKGEIWPNVLNWILGIILVYSTLFGIGEMIFRALVQDHFVTGTGGWVDSWIDLESQSNRVAGLSEVADSRANEAIVEGAD